MTSNSNIFTLICILVTSRVFLCHCVWITSQKYGLAYDCKPLPHCLFEFGSSWHPGGRRVVRYARRSPLPSLVNGLRNIAWQLKTNLRSAVHSSCPSVAYIRRENSSHFSSLYLRLRSKSPTGDPAFWRLSKISSMDGKLLLRTCDARWRSQPRPPSQEHKPVSAQSLWLLSPTLTH